MREKQARSELLEWGANFCGLQRSGTEDTTKVIRMMNPPYRAHKPRPSWHSSSVEIAERNYNIVTGKLSKKMKKLSPAKPWGIKGFFSAQATTLILWRVTSLSLNQKSFL